MRRSTAIRVTVEITVIGCLFAASPWLCTILSKPIPSKTYIGKLNLERPGASLQVRRIPAKYLHAIALLFSRPIQGARKFCAHPDVALSVRVRVVDTDGAGILDDLIAKDRMHWTNWHDGPSIVLHHDQLGERLRPDRAYDLTLLVESAVTGLGQAEVFLHW
jgi:hypothetical protein